MNRLRRPGVSKALITHITIRLILCLVAVVGAVAAAAAVLQVRSERNVQESELFRRSQLLAESLREAVEPLLLLGSTRELQRLVERFGDRERLAGVAVYGTDGSAVAVTSSLSPLPPGYPAAVSKALDSGVDSSDLDRFGARDLHVYALPLRTPERIVGALTILHDGAYIEDHLRGIWTRTFFRVLVQAVLIALVTLVVVHLTIVGPISRISDWMRRLRDGEAPHPPPLPEGDLFAPLAREAETFARHLSSARAAAEEEARLRQSGEALWTASRLREHVRVKLRGRPLLLVSNREPYMHVNQGRRVECIVPAGGLVTALEPVLRASGGTWIAHGAGDADWDVVDAEARIRVPPGDPHYTLKRVALTKEEEHGYYYGFSNEGLWPLCHIAHTRPVFRVEDWEHYRAANEKFALATLQELEGREDACVLVQDYHLALLPRLLKDKRPDLRVGIFWHIPWPNPEAFGICPWQRHLLIGMLGADLIGFHTQYHCNNFLETVDRGLESRVDWNQFTAEKEGHTTLVKPFPISVAFPHVFQDVSEQTQIPDRASVLRGLDMPIRFLGIGVERMDYTKGVLERFRAIDRFLEKYPAYQGQFSFVQMAAPSRTHIKRYHDFLAEVEAEAERINWRYKQGDWRPIRFLKKHHSHEEILPFYRAADLCMVTSLHDGMNLVAKEFVAAREDESGVLVLSRFAGAALELREALIVNPYDTEQMADAIRYALEMDTEEKAARMRRMRAVVHENNIFRWAGSLTECLAQVSMEKVAANTSVR